MTATDRACKTVLSIAAKDVLADPDAVADALIRLCAEPSTTQLR